MTETVPHAEIAVQNVPPAIAPTIPMAITETTKDATPLGTKANATGTIAMVTFQTEVFHKTPRRDLALLVRGMDHRAMKSVIIVIEQTIRRKSERPASNAAEWDIFGAIVAPGPSL